MVYANEWNPIPGQHQSPPDVPYGLDLPSNVADAIKLLVSEGFLDDGCAVFDYLECMHDKIEELERMYWAFRAALQRIEEFEEGSHRYGLVRAIASESLRNNILGE